MSAVFDFLLEGGLHVGGRHVEARLDLAGVRFDRDRRVLLLVAEDPALALGDDAIAEFARGELVAPIAESALGELHDVALVDDVHALALFGERVLDGGAGEALGAFAGDRLDADAARLGEADLLHLHLVLEEGDDLLRFVRLRRPLDAGVDVLRVLAEDHHVDLRGIAHRRGYALEPAHGAEADVEVEHLPERDVERADALADGRRQRTFDADQVFPIRLHRFVGEPGLELGEGFFARVHFVPGDGAFAAVGLLHGGIEHALARAPDIGPGAVTFDERNDGTLGNLQLAGGHRDRITSGGTRKQ